MKTEGNPHHEFIWEYDENGFLVREANPKYRQWNKEHNALIIALNKKEV